MIKENMFRQAQVCWDVGDGIHELGPVCAPSVPWVPMNFHQAYPHTQSTSQGIPMVPSADD
jgi:hypothetical protein